jgi:predicted DNA-binding ArsR family transcriptional regulator
MEVCWMSKPNFKAMSLKELHAYVITHREDDEAFYTYVDKLHAEATWIEMSPLESTEDLENYPEFIKQISKSSKPHDKAV